MRKGTNNMRGGTKIVIDDMNNVRGGTNIVREGMTFVREYKFCERGYKLC